MKKNRWLIALAAAGIHICIGSVYAWSVLTKLVMAEMGLSLSETTWAFSIAILFLGLSAGFLGGIVERLGPRKSGLVSACFFASAMVGTAFAVYVKSAVLLYLFYGCIGGIGLGTGYITPVSTLVKWFLASRLCYGSGYYGIWICRSYCGTGHAVPYCDGRAGGEFPILAAVYAAVMALSASYLRAPRPGEVVPCLQDVLKAEMEKGKKRTVLGPQLTRKAMRTWKWYALWWIFFTNITCGIGLLAVVSPMAQDVIGMAPPKRHPL
ncbi:MAG: hypothetical protein ACLUIQ_07080 [Dialister invisus]